MEETEKMPVVILSLHQEWWRKMVTGEKIVNYPDLDSNES